MKVKGTLVQFYQDIDENLNVYRTNVSTKQNSASNMS